MNRASDWAGRFPRPQSQATAFGLESTFPGHFTSNDLGYLTVRPDLQESFAEINGGLGLFVGAGGRLSLLPDLKTDATVMVDRNIRVIEFDRVLSEIILESDSAKRALATLRRGIETECRPVLKAINQLLHEGAIDSRIEAEARVYGEDHWTDRHRFHAVKAALAAKPREWLPSDVRHPRFAGQVALLAQQHGEVSFANLTNVHMWLRRDELPTVTSIPYSAEPIIVFSSYYNSSDSGPMPTMQVANSIEDYLDATAGEARP